MITISTSSEGTSKQKAQLRDFVLAFFVIGTGMLFFFFVARAISDVMQSTWILSSVLAVIFTAFLSIFAVTSCVKKYIIPVTMIAFIPSIIFMLDIIHVCIVFVMAALALRGLYMMRKTVCNMVHINIYAVVRSGVTYISIALVVIVSSQYYCFLRENETEVFFGAQHTAVSRIIAHTIVAQNNTQTISLDTMTVDDFLLFVVQNIYTQKQQETATASEDARVITRLVSKVGVNIEKMQEDAQQIAVKEMRSRLALFANRELTGEEHIIDVFSSVVDVQIRTLMKSNAFIREYKAEIFSLVLFVVLISLMSVIRIISNVLACFIFFILRQTHIIKITYVQRDVEIIEA